MAKQSNFSVKLSAILDTAQVNKQIDKVIGKQKVILKNVTINPAGLAEKIQAALNKHNFTLNLTNVKVDGLSNQITGSVGKIGQAAGMSFSQSFTNQINTRLRMGDLDKSLSSVTGKFNTLKASLTGLDTSALSGDFHARFQQLETDLNTLIALRNNFLSGNLTNAQYMANWQEYNAVLQRIRNNLTITTNETKRFASATEVATLQNRMEAWLGNNSRAVKTYGSTIQGLISRLRELSAQGNVEKTQLRQLAAEFVNVKTAAQAAGLTGKTFGDSLKGAFASITRYISASTLIYTAINAIRNGIKDVVALDTALIDLKKTTDATEAELKEFYYTANDIAKQLGVTTESVISAAAAWSRLGYSIEDAETMAKTSSIFTSISPNMDIEEATDGLVSAMKAFNIEADDALDGIASKINIIGNTQAVSNKDIVEFLTRSSAAMKVANNSLDETIALGTAATEVTRDASSVGNAMKTDFCFCV